jgi:hypothetical protein
MSTLVHYRIYGLKVASDRELTGVVPCDGFREPDVACHLGKFPADADLGVGQSEKPIYVSRLRDSRGIPILQVWRFSRDGRYCFQFCEGVAFLIDAGGREIWAQWDQPAARELVGAFLLSPIFGFVLHLRGCVCVHASSVVIDGLAVLFAGGQGRGKSSTAAAFAERGFPVITDDVSPIRMEADGELVVVPGLPRVCLWPDSVEFVYGAGAADLFPRLEGQEEKRLVHLDSARGEFQEEPVPLGAVYMLAPRTDAPTAPKIEKLEQAERLTLLLPNGFVSSALDSEHRAREFRLHGEISRKVPVQRLVPSSHPKKLGELCELVLNDLRAANFSHSGQAR